MAWIERKKGKRRWRVGWRVGGRKAKPQHSEWTDDLVVAEDFLKALDEQQLETKSTSGRLILPWSEVRAKWLATKKGRYRVESKSTLELHTKHWRTTSDATPTAMAKLPIGTIRAARSCVRWAWLHLKQPMDLRAMKVAPTRRRAKKAKPQLSDDAKVIELIDKAATWSPGNGAICHVIALYGPRAESLVGLDGDVFDGSGLTYTNKNGEVERQILAPWTIAVINALDPKPGKPLFVNHLGVPWKTGKDFASWFHHQIGEGVGYKVLLRCTSMTRLLELAGDAKTASNVSKHKTVHLIPNTYSLDSEVKERELVGKVAQRLAAFSGPRLVEKA